MVRLYKGTEGGNEYYKKVTWKKKESNPGVLPKHYFQSAPAFQPSNPNGNVYVPIKEKEKVLIEQNSGGIGFLVPGSVPTEQNSEKQR